jgi:hypothetical protein
MDMKKVFISLGIGVMVVTGLIQSGVIDVNEISKEADFASSQSSSTSEGGNLVTPEPSPSEAASQAQSNKDINKTAKVEKRSLFDTPEPIEVEITKTKIGLEKFCPKNLPDGTYTFTVQDTQFYIFNPDGSGRALIDTIIAGRSVPDTANFPYKENNYSYGILVNNKPNLAKVKIKGCFSTQFNTFPEAKSFGMEPTKITLTFTR